MMHPDMELRFVNTIIGYGVFATLPIPRGTLTWVRDSLDQVITDPALLAMPEPLRSTVQKYPFRNHHGENLLLWDIGRYVNHSCVPTCIGIDVDYDVAVRDIRAGEEITNDYATFYLREDEEFQCYCGSVGCRRIIGPGDAAMMSLAWRLLFERAQAQIHFVNRQPLYPLYTTLFAGTR